jgi:hypothetical protein
MEIVCASISRAKWLVRYNIRLLANMHYSLESVAMKNFMKFEWIGMCRRTPRTSQLHILSEERKPGEPFCFSEISVTACSALLPLAKTAFTFVIYLIGTGM